MEYLIKRIQQISNAVWWNIIVRLSDEPVKHLFCSSICSPDIIDELDRHSYDEALFDGIWLNFVETLPIWVMQG